MHSKYDKLVVFLIVCGSLLMLFGAAYYLWDYLFVNENIAGGESAITTLITEPEAPEVTTEVEGETGQQLSEKRFINLIIEAVNNREAEEESYRNLSLQQKNQIDFSDFKLYIANLREAAQGKVVGVKALSNTERRIIELEMLENDPLNALYIRNYEFYYLVSEVKEKNYSSDKSKSNNIVERRLANNIVAEPGNEASAVSLHTEGDSATETSAYMESSQTSSTLNADEQAETATVTSGTDAVAEAPAASVASKEKLNLLVFDKTDKGFLSLNNRLITAMIEPSYTIKLYLDAIANDDVSVLANILYTDLPNDVSLRLAKAHVYIDYYKTQIAGKAETYRIEEIRPDQWIISFPLDTEAPLIDSWEVSQQVLDKLDKESSHFTGDVIRFADAEGISSSDIAARASEWKTADKSVDIGSFSKLHYWPKYYERLTVEKNRHYVKFARRNNAMTAIDVLPLDSIAGAWTFALVNKDNSHINLTSNDVKLTDISDIFSKNGSFRPMYYKEAGYNAIFLPRLEENEKAEKSYNQVWNFNSDYVDAYSLMKKSDNLQDLKLNMLILSGDKVKTTSRLQLGMSRRRIISLYPGIDACNYRISNGRYVMELRFDNQSKGRLELNAASPDDQLVEISYYDLNWFQQNFDILNLDISPSYVED